MNNRVIVYNGTSGLIYSVENEPVTYYGDDAYGDPAIQVPTIEHVNPNEYYVNVVTRTLTLKTRMSLAKDVTAVADGVDMISISGIENGTTAVASLPEGLVEATITDGSISATSNIMGKGTITLITSPIYLDEIIEVTFT